MDPFDLVCLLVSASILGGAFAGLFDRSPRAVVVLTYVNDPAHGWRKLDRTPVVKS